MYWIPILSLLNFARHVALADVVAPFAEVYQGDVIYSSHPSSSPYPIVEHIRCKTVEEAREKKRLCPGAERVASICLKRFASNLQSKLNDPEKTTQLLRKLLSSEILELDSSKPSDRNTYEELKSSFSPNEAVMRFQYRAEAACYVAYNVVGGSTCNCTYKTDSWDILTDYHPTKQGAEKSALEQCTSGNYRTAWNDRGSYIGTYSRSGNLGTILFQTREDGEVSNPVSCQ